MGSALARGSRRLGAAPMRGFFSPDTLSFPREDLVRQAAARFPVMLNIEPTLRCNSSCVMCPRRLARRPAGDMDMGLLARLVSEMAAEGSVQVVNLHKDGEPLLHPRLEEMASRLKNSGACAFVHFNTNALLLDAERGHRLLDSGTDDVTMSIDAVTPETYFRVKGREGLGIVEANVLGLLDLRARKGQDTPWVRAKIVAMPETESEIEPFIRRWEGVADEVQVQEVHNYGGGNAHAGASQAGRYPCQAWWSSMAVNWDGTASVCAVDFSGEVILGDLNTETIAQVFRGPAYTRHRQAMLRGDFGTHALCSACTVWRVGPDQSAWYRELAGRTAG
jgi:hypothetical protein